MGRRSQVTKMPRSIFHRARSKRTGLESFMADSASGLMFALMVKASSQTDLFQTCRFLEIQERWTRGVCTFTLLLTSTLNSLLFPYWLRLLVSLLSHQLPLGRLFCGERMAKRSLILAVVFLRMSIKCSSTSPRIES